MFRWSFLSAIFVLILFGFSCSEGRTKADLILFNGRIYTAQEADPFAEAIALRNNKILAVGTSDEIIRMADASTRRFDLRGKLVIPGFNDAHIHFLRGSLSLQSADLNACKTVESAVQTIASFATQHPSVEWVTGSGWQYTVFPGGKPTKDLLDAVIPDRPVFVYAYDGHSAWVNSVALQRAGITRATQYAGFGSIVKDERGEPTGMLTEGAMQLVRDLLPLPSKADQLQALENGLRYAASLGITSLQNASGTLEEFALYEELLHKGKLSLRYAAAFSAGEKTTPEDIDRFSAIKDRYRAHTMLRADAVKFLLDGVIESHTAVMMEDYSDAGEQGKSANGVFALPLSDYQRLTAAFDEASFRIYTHAIGDRSVHEALNAYEQAQQKNRSRQRRHRIEHIEQCKPSDVQRFHQLNVLPSMQPIHADPATVAVWSKAVGEARLPNSFGWQSMLQSRARLVFGSDWPACIDLSPIHGLHVAVNRQSPDGQPTGGWVPQQRIGIREALDAYTSGGAYSSFEENIKGKLQPGYLADLVVLSQDLFQIPSSRIHSTQVLMTVVDGKIIHKANGWE